MNDKTLTKIKMAKATTNTAAQEILGAKYNAHVKTAKQTVNDENGNLVKGLFYLNITTDKGTMQINVGNKTYNAVKKLTGIE